jgi:hypothetical protein
MLMSVNLTSDKQAILLSEIFDGGCDENMKEIDVRSTCARMRREDGLAQKKDKNWNALVPPQQTSKRREPNE